VFCKALIFQYGNFAGSEMEPTNRRNCHPRRIVWNATGFTSDLILLKQFMKENRMVHKIALKFYNLMIRKDNSQDGSVAGCGKGEIVKKKNTNTLISKNGRVAEFELASAWWSVKKMGISWTKTTAVFRIN
jgi:hypothetical protein